MKTFGLIVTTRSFFPAHLVSTAKELATELLTKLGYAYVTPSGADTALGAVRTYDEVVKCAALFKANADKISGIIVIMPNFGEEAGVADAIKLAGLGVPVLVQACDDDFDKLDMRNRRDAFCGKLSLCNNLYQMGIPFSNTSLHTCAIDSPAFAADLKKFAAVCDVVAAIRNSRIALLGIRPSAFRTVRFSEKLLQRTGIDIETVDMSDVIARALAMTDEQRVGQKIAQIKEYGSIPGYIGTDKVARQARLCLAIEDTVEALDCDASAVQCWDALQNHYGCASCLAMSMMGDAGKPSACESDIMGAVTMLAMSRAAGSAAAYMDWNNNLRDERDKCICLHCANFPKSFFHADIEIENLDVLGSTLGADRCFGACKGQVAPGPMTFAKITTDDYTGTLRAYVGEGEFLSETIPTKGGVACCEVKGLQDLMKYICNNGYEHHVCFVRGHVADIIQEAWSKYLSIHVYRHV